MEAARAQNGDLEFDGEVEKDTTPPGSLGRNLRRLTPDEQDLFIAEQKLVYIVAIKMIQRLSASVELDDLMSVGRFGLWDAIIKYDPLKGTEFRAYAKVRIRGAIMDSLREADWISRSARARGRTICKLRESGMSYEDIAMQLGIPLEKVLRIEAAVSRALIVSYEDLSVRHGSSDKRQRHFLETVVDERTLEGPVGEALDKDDISFLAKKFLSETNRVVFLLYYFEGMNLKEIASLFGVTESRISQIKSQAEVTLFPIIKAYLENNLADEDNRALQEAKRCRHLQYQADDIVALTREKVVYIRTLREKQTLEECAQILGITVQEVRITRTRLAMRMRVEGVTT